MQALPLTDKVLEETIREIFKCQKCEGTGRIPNPYFENCREEWHDHHNKQCSKSCLDYEFCSMGERITCFHCSGTGYEKLSWQEFLKRLKELDEEA